jgi:hypothetical protein
MTGLGYLTGSTQSRAWATSWGNGPQFYGASLDRKAARYAIWLMNGSTISSAVSLGQISTAWSVVGTGDFNGDGNTDILWRDNTGNVAIWFMNGTTITSTANLGNVLSTVWSVAGTGDFNGDGKSDIFWRDTSGDLAIWLMNGGTISSATSLGTISPAWTMALTGDYNGDGLSDILWEDTSGDGDVAHEWLDDIVGRWPRNSIQRVVDPDSRRRVTGAPAHRQKKA